MGRDRWEALKAFNQQKVIHRQFQAAIDMMDECRLHARLGNPDTLCFILEAPSGFGKTTLIECYTERFQPDDSGRARTTPLLSIIVPESPRLKIIVSKLLRAVGYLYPDKGTTGERSMRLIEQVKECGVEAIILDDFHRFYKFNRSLNEEYQIADWLVNLIRSTKVPVFLFGLPGSASLLEEDGQLDRSFRRRLALEAFSVTTSAERSAEFRDFITTLTAGLNFRRPTLDGGQLFRIWCATAGISSHTVDLHRNLAAIAARHDLSQVGIKHFAQACDASKIRETHDRPNPFRTSLEILERQLEAELAGEAKTGKKLGLRDAVPPRRGTGRQAERRR